MLYSIPSSTKSLSFTVTISLWQGHCWIGKKHKQVIYGAYSAYNLDLVALWNSYLYLISVNVSKQNL